MAKEKETEEKKPVETLHITELIDLAYDIAKEQFGDKFFSFSAIWSKVWKSAERFSKEKVENWIGYFYTELALDPRFTLFNFNNWKLREFVPIKEIQKLEKTIFSGEQIFEEEYEVYLDAVKDKNKEVEMVITDDSADDIVEEDITIKEEEEDSDEEGAIDKTELFEAEEE